ncbi:MAG: hypothetical protein PVI22_15860, partial [Lysobacterales bacterium]
MASGIVTNWSENPVQPPFATVAVSLLCIFAYLVYARLAPVMQQVMIEVVGARPASLAALRHSGLASWWDLS